MMKWLLTHTNMSSSPWAKRVITPGVRACAAIKSARVWVRWGVVCTEVAQHFRMFVETWSHRTAPSDSWQSVCPKIFVKCLKMCTNSQSVLVNACWDHFPKLADTNLWLWRGLKSDWQISTCFLCPRSPAAYWLKRKHGSRILVFSIGKHKVSCVLFKSSWFSHRRLLISWLLWRYSYFNHQSSCIFEHFNSNLWSDLDMIGKNSL